MSMDELQVLALSLAIVGIALTIFHVYSNDFSKRVSDFIERALKYAGVDQFVNMTGGIDYDFEDLTEIEREQVFHTRCVTILVVFLATPFCYMSTEYGDGVLWNIIEFISAYFLSFLYIIGAQYLLVLMIQIPLIMCRISGRGDIVVGVGFILSLSGLGIGVYQIYYSSLSWTLWIIASITILTPSAFLLRKRRKNTNST